MVSREEKKKILLDIFGYLSEEEENEEDGQPETESLAGIVSQGGPGLTKDAEPEDVDHNCEDKYKSPSSLEVHGGNQRENEGRREPGDVKGSNRAPCITDVIRDIFGESDDEEQGHYTAQDEIDSKEKRSLVDEERNSGKELRPEDVVHDKGVPYEPEIEYAKAEHKEKYGLSLVLEIPSRDPLADPHMMHMVKLSNIVSIDPRPFDPRTYVSQDFFMTDKSGTRRHIPTENIVRWRNVKNSDGTTSVESNSRFVIWDDDSLQLLIGNESSDVSERDMHDIQAHLFSIHGKEILKCEGRFRKKMHFMPSSLTSDAHRTFSGLVDARYKKEIKVKRFFAEIDPEWEIENRRKVQREMNKANKQHGRKKGKFIHEHKETLKREQNQLSLGFMKSSADQQQDVHRLRLSAAQFQFKESLDRKAGKEIHHFNAKNASHSYHVNTSSSIQVPKRSRKLVLPAASSSRLPIDLSATEENVSKYSIQGKDYDGSPSDSMRPVEKRQNCKKEEAYEDPEVKSEVIILVVTSHYADEMQISNPKGGGFFSFKKKKIELPWVVARYLLVEVKKTS